MAEDIINKDNEESNTKNTNKFTQIKKYIGYFLMFSSAVSVIGGTSWGVASWVLKKDTQAVISEKAIERSFKEDSLQNLKIDFVIKKLEKLDAIDDKVNALQNSYILYMKNNLTKDDFRNYMEGITWEKKTSSVTGIVSNPLNPLYPLNPIH